MQISTAVADLTWSILTELHNDNGKPASIIFSPLSISIALGMLTGAADGEVKKTLCTKLGISKEEDLPLLSKIGLGDTGSGSHSSLSSANAIFMDSTIEIYPAYKAFLAAFQAEPCQYPNIADHVDQINLWISDRTLGLIQNMLSKAQLATAHAVLVNAVAFKGAWEAPFDPKDTRNVSFYITSLEEKSVKMMFKNKRNISAYQHAKFDAVKLDYVSASSSKMSMTAYLPKEGVSTQDILKLLSAQKGLTSSSNFIDIKYDQFGFPKFEVLSDFSLMNLLSSLGYPIGGSFPRMGTGNNVVQDILHKAFIKVDEQGTTAAAATAVIMTRSRPMNPKVLIFNRPFVYTIVSHETGTVLFAGIYAGE